MRLLLLIALSSCTRVSTEAGRASSGASCTTDTDCPAGFRCDEGVCKVRGLSTLAASVREPMCQTCETDFDCGDDGRTGCWLPNAQGKLARCSFDCTVQQCPDDLECRPDDEGGTKTCWPKSGACPSSPEDAVCNDDTWESFAGKLFTDKCTSCHDVMGTVDGVKSKSKDIRAVVDARTMPPREKLADDVAKQLVTWIDCGMKP